MMDLGVNNQDKAFLPNIFFGTDCNMTRMNSLGMSIQAGELGDNVMLNQRVSVSIADNFIYLIWP